VSKKEQRQFEDKEEDKEMSDDQPIPMPVNPKKIRKITKDGPFSGKNKIFFDKDLNPITSMEYHFGK
jgi:hypothetical protein